MGQAAEEARRRVTEVIERLEAAGHRALLVGGAVRDLLLGREPTDFDVATSARPEEVIGLFAETVAVGAAFGVVLVLVDGEALEVATFRGDAEYRDGRHPVSVALVSEPGEDARRRDFTVNGLFMEAATGEILDFVGGREDLDRRVIRAIGDARERFREDRLRMLRAVRFSCALDFAIEEETFQAVREMAGEVGSLSAERVRDELVRLLTGPHRGRGLDLLRETGLLREILPEVQAMVGVLQPPEFHPEGDVFRHTCLTLDALSDPGPVLGVAALLHDVGKPGTYVVRERIRFDDHAEQGAVMAGEICRRLRFSRAVTEAVEELVRDHLRFMMVEKMREARLRRFLTGPLAPDHLALHRADCLASHGNLEHWEYCRRRREEYLSEPPPAKRLITGRDLIEMGYLPGPRFAEILGEVEDRHLEGRLKDRSEALEFVRRRFPVDEDERHGE